MDYVWDIATVEMLIACFQRVERGNKIILTSQSSKVGLQVKCRNDLLYHQLLTREKSWDLLKKKGYLEIKEDALLNYQNLDTK